MLGDILKVVTKLPIHVAGAAEKVLTGDKEISEDVDEVRDDALSDVEELLDDIF